MPNVPAQRRNDGRIGIVPRVTSQSAQRSAISAVPCAVARLTGVGAARRHALGMASADDCCVTLAARQHGCVSRAQAIRCGLSADAVGRRCRSRRWARLLPGVYSVRGAPQTPEQRQLAAYLWAGEGAALSHGTAAWCWRFPDATPGIPEISHGGNRRGRSDVVVHRVSLDDGDATMLDGVRVTTPARTLVDLAARLRSGAFDAAFHYCLHRRLTTVRAVEAIAARRAGRPGAAIVRDALDAYSGGRPAGSPLEARVARLLRHSGLPAPRRQHPVRAGERVRRLDFAWPQHLVALEVDGYRWHSSRGAWESDRARTSELRRAGWTVVTATHDDVGGDGAGLIAELKALIAQ